MGYIAATSATTASAYITELGRQYLFGNGPKPRFYTDSNGVQIDRFEPVNFSVGDPDTNYNLPIEYQLAGGTVPDLGGNLQEVILGAKGRALTSLITPKDASFQTQITSLQYSPSTPIINIDFSKDLSTIPTIFTIQLMTFINGQNFRDGMYSVTPTNYGATNAQNGELAIVLRDATQSQVGYRMRIFFPGSGSNYNKLTIQFEAGQYVTGNITETYAKTFSTNQVNLGGLNFGGINLQNIEVQ